MQYTIPKGVFDILPCEAKEEDAWRNVDHWQYVEEILKRTATEYGYREIRPPVFERTELFVRSVGESSDIVTKEMYTFLDKGERSMSLRPEATASVIRAFVEKKLYNQPGLHKFFSIGPMFRYERPQAGRYRQFHQFSVEALGNKTPDQDVELIDLLCEICRRLGLKEFTVMINSLGDDASKLSYKEALTNYLRPHFEGLSADSQTRFSKNILRILDSKDPQDQKILEGAPSVLDHLTPESAAHFRCVCELLALIKIPFKINPRLVRGLDYYNQTVFEVIGHSLGAQNAMGGGGRYDGLISAFGGPDIPSMGFAMGIERILQSMVAHNISFPPPAHPLLFIVPLGDKSREFCFNLLCQLRHEGIAAEMDMSGKKVGQALALANILQAEYSLVVGEEELTSQMAKLKNMASRETIDVRLPDLIHKMKELRV
jgi:histidyl-tRNA synthetase